MTNHSKNQDMRANHKYSQANHLIITQYNIPKIYLKSSRFCELYSKTWTVIFEIYMLLHAIERIFLYCSSGVPAELYPFWEQQNSWAAKINKWLMNKMVGNLSFHKQKTP